ncbi:MAG: hypothetical protein A3F12_01335 [Gammaproteobacteria bacterium RIFCSPHIGHO2_12_FULL_38_14]|nr:MAG: hypothetical protein A3F12_01335 [Gammaproteobacteria bacterium RIFCSPHIGHO2_12_FULL_38_14]
MKRICFWINVIITITFAPLSFAFNLSFLNNSPIAYFTQEDFRIMETSALKTLNSGKDNQKITWKNPKTKSWGYAIASNTTIQDGRTCRNLTIYNNANGITDKSDYNFCKFGKDWRVVINQR